LFSPVSYLEMVALENNASVIITDSGGVQKEAYWYRRPCVTLRDETEWIETVARGWNILAGANRSNIVDAVQVCEVLPESYDESLYGDGASSELIYEILLNFSQNDFD